MVLSLSISSEAEAKLSAKAAAAGVDLQTYAAQQLERAAKAPPSLWELSGPAADAFAESGMSEDELGELLEQEKHAMRGLDEFVHAFPSPLIRWRTTTDFSCSQGTS